MAKLNKFRSSSWSRQVTPVCFHWSYIFGRISHIERRNISPQKLWSHYVNKISVKYCILKN